MNTLFDTSNIATDDRAKQLRTMHDDHGVTEGQVCENCAHLFRGRYHDRNYFKCRLYTPWTHGPGTDWRLSWQACGKFEIRQTSIDL